MNFRRATVPFALRGCLPTRHVGAAETQSRMADSFPNSTIKEENFLQSFFNGLAQSAFDKCKDAIVSVKSHFKA